MTSNSSVLLADDDPSIGKLVVHLLSGHSITATHVLDGQRAIDFLKREQPSLIITDLQMPNVDGHALTKHVVQNYPNIPVVVLTNTGTEKDAVTCFREGAADYVKKESLNSELVPIVEKLLAEEKAFEKVGEDPALAPVPLHDVPATPEAAEGESHPLASEYRVLRWGNAISNTRWHCLADRELSDQKLRVLRRQVDRIDKWVKVANECRRHPRHAFANVVYMIPLDKDGAPSVDMRFAVFCREVSEGGCSVMHNRLLREKDWAVFFPTLKPLQKGACCYIATIRRDRAIPMGLYEIGMQFIREYTLPKEDVVLMSAKRR